MPPIRIHYSIQDNQNNLMLLKEISSDIANVLEKILKYVKTPILNNLGITFSKNNGHYCYIKVISIGYIDNSVLKGLSSIICKVIENLLKSNSEHIYMKFEDVPRILWGWDSNRFEIKF